MASELFPAAAPDVLYLVDLSSYVLRAYHAIAPLSSPSGEPTNAVHGTVTMLERLIRERRPALMAIAMDAGRDTFRREMYAEYKAHRPPAPPDLVPQLARTEAIVRAFGVTTYQERGVEADDLIATAVRAAREHGLRAVIVASDKDLMQLVGPDVVLWDTMRDRVVGPPEVEERFGVRVEQLGDLLSLMGDSSDNVPGVPHVGPKTARELLQKFGTLDGIYEHVAEVAKKGVRETLAAHEADARISRRLVTLKDDCPIDFDLERLRPGARDLTELRRHYSELGFRRQLTELDALPPAVPAATAVEPPRVLSQQGEYETLLDEAALVRFVESAARTKRLAVEVATEPDSALRGGLVGIGLAVAPGRGAYLPLAHRYVGAPRQLTIPAVLERLAPILADDSIVKSALDLKRTAVALSRHGGMLEGFGFDASLVSYLIDPEARHDREALAERDLGIKAGTRDALTARGRGRRVGFDELECGEATPFVAAGADYALRLDERLRPRLSDAGLDSLYEHVELPLARQLVDSRARGRHARHLGARDARRRVRNRGPAARTRRAPCRRPRIQRELPAPARNHPVRRARDEADQAHEDLALDGRRHAGSARRVPRAAGHRARDPSAHQAQGHVHRCAARARQPVERGACTRAGTKPSPRRAGCR